MHSFEECRGGGGCCVSLIKFFPEVLGVPGEMIPCSAMETVSLTDIFLKRLA